MKKLLLALLLFCLLPCFSYGQAIPIDSFYVPGAHWTVAALYSWSDEPEDGYWTYDYGANGRVFGITGDTIVSGVFYRKLGLSAYGSYEYDSTMNCTLPYPSPCISSSGYSYSDGSLSFEYVGRVRIDSNRVYFILDKTSTSFDYFTTGSFVQGQEYLLYDFNILPGGSFNSEVCDDAGYSVSAIDSVLLSNGTHVSRYSDGFGYWIWGIGQPGGPFGDYRQWWCTYVDEPYPGPGNEYNSSYSLCYDNPHFNYQFSYTPGTLLGNLQYDCFDISILSTKNVEIPNSKISIYPNPTTTELTIQSTNYPITQITITNLLGQVVYSRQFTVGSSQTVDVSGFVAGVYFVKVNGVEVRKLVKE